MELKAHILEALEKILGNEDYRTFNDIDVASRLWERSVQGIFQEGIRAELDQLEGKPHSSVLVLKRATGTYMLYRLRRTDACCVQCARRVQIYEISENYVGGLVGGLGVVAVCNARCRDFFRDRLLLLGAQSLEASSYLQTSGVQEVFSMRVGDTDRRVGYLRQDWVLDVEG